jgi:hypothetical protein
MKNFREKLDRKNVTAEKVTKSYEGCEQFLLSFGRAYICVAALEFWGLEDLCGTPTKHTPPAGIAHQSLNKKREYFDKVVGEFIDEFVMADPDREAINQFKEWQEQTTKRTEMVNLDHDYAMKPTSEEVALDEDFPPDMSLQTIENDKADRIR